jgi:uncharacterized protein YggE
MLPKETQMKCLLRATALSLVMAMAGGAVASAQAAPCAGDTMFRATTLNLAAYGDTKIKPDMAIIKLGVMTRADTAAAAMQANAARIDQVMAALEKAGIAAKDFQTSNLNLAPQYA